MLLAHRLFKRLRVTRAYYYKKIRSSSRDQTRGLESRNSLVRTAPRGIFGWLSSWLSRVFPRASPKDFRREERENRETYISLLVAL